MNDANDLGFRGLLQVKVAVVFFLLELLANLEDVLVTTAVLRPQFCLFTVEPHRFIDQRCFELLVIEHKILFTNPIDASVVPFDLYFFIVVPHVNKLVNGLLDEVSVSNLAFAFFLDFIQNCFDQLNFILRKNIISVEDD